jgi:hypothetical protein
MTISSGQTGNIEYAYDYYCQEVLQFFRKYPYCHYCKRAVVHALNSGNIVVMGKALEKLVSDGMLSSSCRNGVKFYTLNEKK